MSEVLVVIMKACERSVSEVLKSDYLSNAQSVLVMSHKISVLHWKHRPQSNSVLYFSILVDFELELMLT